MKLVSIKKFSVPRPEGMTTESKPDAVPHSKYLGLQWTCDECKCVNVHKINSLSVYTLEQVEAIAIAAFNFAFFECKCCHDKTAKSIQTKK